MRRSSQDIIDQADELADFFETGFTSGTPREIAVLRGAAHRRAVAEGDVATAVAEAIRAGHPWRVIGEAVGTTGEAARQRYGGLVGQSAPMDSDGPKRIRKAGRAKLAGLKAAAATEVTKKSAKTLTARKSRAASPAKKSRTSI